MEHFSPEEIDRAKREVVEIAQELIRFDTSNFGPSEDTKSTWEAAQYVMRLLHEAGISPELIETAPGYWNVVGRWESDDETKPGMIWHGHLDVVPEGKNWTVPAFEGRITDDGYLYGRGAVDMKSQDATLLATVLMWARAGMKPPRDMVLCFFADEEAGGFNGARPLVKNYPELFKNCDVVIGGEVGGFSFQPPGFEQPNFTISHQERGMWWWKGIATAEQGHGSFYYPEGEHAGNLILDFVAEVRSGLPQQPALSPQAINSLNALATAVDKRFYPDNPDEFLAHHLGAMAKWVRTSTRDTANVNILEGGIKVNMTPVEAALSVDSRFMPGSTFITRVEELARKKGVAIENISEKLNPWQSSDSRPEIDAMTAAVLEHYPNAVFSLLRNPAGTDAKAFQHSAGTDARAFQDLLGRPIDTYGFGPLPLPATEPFPDLFHGPDERVPIKSLEDSVDIMSALIANSAGVPQSPKESALTVARIGVPLGQIQQNIVRGSGYLPPGTILKLA